MSKEGFFSKSFSLKNVWILVCAIHIVLSTLISMNRSVMFLHIQHSQSHNHPMTLKAFMNGQSSQWPVSTEMV